MFTTQSKFEFTSKIDGAEYGINVPSSAVSRIGSAIVEAGIGDSLVALDLGNSLIVSSPDVENVERLMALAKGINGVETCRALTPQSLVKMSDGKSGIVCIEQMLDTQNVAHPVVVRKNGNQIAVSEVRDLGLRRAVRVVVYRYQAVNGKWCLESVEVLQHTLRTDGFKSTPEGTKCFVVADYNGEDPVKSCLQDVAEFIVTGGSGEEVWVKSYAEHKRVDVETATAVLVKKTDGAARGLGFALRHKGYHLNRLFPQQSQQRERDGRSDDRGYRSQKPQGGIKTLAEQLLSAVNSGNVSVVTATEAPASKEKPANKREDSKKGRKALAAQAAALAEAK
ncbi:MAG: hypothetical protein WCT26_02470 [Candidatus Buchananbacteria bacterium]|jgi:hypothetical protein